MTDLTEKLKSILKRSDFELLDHIASLLLSGDHPQYDASNDFRSYISKLNEIRELIIPDYERINEWIDRQLSGELENVIGEPGEFEIKAFRTTLGLAAICKKGAYLIDTHEEIDIVTEGNC